MEIKRWLSAMVMGLGGKGAEAGRIPLSVVCHFIHLTHSLSLVPANKMVEK